MSYSARAAAQRVGDGQGWATSTTDDFLTIGADGVVKTKAQRVQEIRGTTVTNPAPPKDERFRSYGTTIIRTWRTEPQNGRPMRFTEVWVNQNGAWKVATVHMSVIAKP